MKRTTILLCIALLGLILLTGCTEPTGMKIGIVDEDAAFKDNAVTVAAMAYLQEIGAPLQKKAEEAYKKMQAEQTEDNVAAYKQAMGELQNIMNGEQQRVVALVEQEFTKALNKYRVEKGLTLILSKKSAISFDDTINITDDIVASMSTLKLDFKAPATTDTAPKTAKKDKE